VAEREFRTQVGDAERHLHLARAADQLAENGAHGVGTQGARILGEGALQDLGFALGIKDTFAVDLFQFPNLLSERGAAVDRAD
jgi:hypothetical protein